MTEVLRVLNEDEASSVMPARELLEPEASQVLLATINAVTNMINAGVKVRAGHLLVRTTGGIEVSSNFRVYIPEN